MNIIKRKVYNSIGKIINRFSSVTAQKSVGESDKNEYNNEKAAAFCRLAAAESIVMLKNINSVLPLNKNDTVTVFGRVQNDYFYVGYGSGGDVIAPYKSNIIDALKNSGIRIESDTEELYKNICKKHPVNDGFWGHWPMSYEEIVPEDKDIISASLKSNKAIVLIGRSSGEDRECLAEKGSYYLTDEEKSLLDKVTAHFDKVILLMNCGCIMDMSEIVSYADKISSILYVWQGGMESGNAIADVLSGKISPCGKLTDTIADKLSDYPSTCNFGNKSFNNYEEDIYVGYRYFESFKKDCVIYPFGYGLSYASFSLTDINYYIDDETIRIDVSVTNTGKYAGKETVQVYYEAPQGKLGKPSRELCAFKKTNNIKPQEKETVYLDFNIADMASYDDIQSFSYILEKGKYNIYIGTDVRSAIKCGEYILDENRTVQTLSQCCAPKNGFDIITKHEDGTIAHRKVTTNKKNLKNHIINNLKESDTHPVKKNLKLTDIIKGEVKLEDFVSQLNNEELEAISRGDYTMNSSLGPAGNAGVLGGVLQSLRDKGIPALVTTDGPSGIRIAATATLLPIGTALACTWNPELVCDLYSCIGEEMLKLKSDILLAPGMNIHRSPLCGRNFEYLSEDPLLTGYIASAIVKGIQSNGVSACPKHFACNNQETARTHSDSRVSERALREIYLKGFEICVKNAEPDCIMTSYNKVNGVWSHYSYELVTDILRNEWEFDGLVMTDWWMQSSSSPEFPEMKDQAYRVRSGINVLMPGGKRVGKHKPDGTLLKTLGMKDGITYGELRTNASYVIKLAIKKIVR
ncbi:MAG: glycoside hydrolase family 3 C-terminal domain-containing protein [Clostridia bacterium]|nr:glycoside hydrolase family 3 C-terminal domain-containing protein [Clostridia bacterium]